MDKNHEKIKSLNLKEYEGECIGLVNGEIISHNQDVQKVIDSLPRGDATKEVSMICVPKSDKVFVL